jgi:hypothetical protein
MCDTCPEPDLDSLPRAQLRGGPLGDMPGDVADVLDDWLVAQHGVFSSHHGVGAFLDLLAAAGYRVTRTHPGAPIEQLLPPAAD